MLGERCPANYYTVCRPPPTHTHTHTRLPHLSFPPFRFPLFRLSVVHYLLVCRGCSRINIDDRSTLGLREYIPWTPAVRRVDVESRVFVGEDTTVPSKSRASTHTICRRPRTQDLSSPSSIHRSMRISGEQGLWFSGTRRSSGPIRSRLVPRAKAVPSPVKVCNTGRTQRFGNAVGAFTSCLFPFLLCPRGHRVVPNSHDRMSARDHASRIFQQRGRRLSQLLSPVSFFSA